MDHLVRSALAKGHVQGVRDQFASQMDRADPVCKHDIDSGPFRGGPHPAVIAAGGDLQEAYTAGERDRRPAAPL